MGYLKITTKELQALIETADTCIATAQGEESVHEAELAESAYKNVLSRNNLRLAERTGAR